MNTCRRTRLKAAASRRATGTFSSASRVSIVRKGADQSVWLPRGLRFPESVKEVHIRKQGVSLLISPVRSDWASFFARKVRVPEDYLEPREDTPPQERESLRRRRR